MKKHVMKKWVAALRSGKYKQTRGRLHNKRGGGYCCLGVLCEISGMEFNPNDGMIPYSVENWSGLRTRKGSCADTNLRGESLASYNDHSKLSFKAIANIIEKH